LKEAAVVDPGVQFLLVALEGGVAFGVGDDGNEAGVEEFAKDLAHGGKGDEIGKLNQQVGTAVDGVFSGVKEGVAEVVVGEMEVATSVEVGGAGVESGELADGLGDDVGMEGVLGIAMGSRNKFGGTGGCGEAEHRKTFFKGGRTVVETWQDVRVEVNH
jgi:hypothetical protein